MEKKQVTSKVLTIKGIVKFPQFDTDNGFSAKLCLDDETMTKLEEDIEEIGEEIAVKEMQDETYRNGINVKSKFDFPVFDKAGKELFDEQTKDPAIYDGAKVLMKINFKKYEYKENKGRRSFTKTGVTGYLLGAVVIEQGEKYESSTTFEDFRAFTGEDIPF